MSAKRQPRERTEVFLRSNPVFSLEDLAEFIGRPNARRTARSRVKYHLARGRLKTVARGVYASVPPGQSTSTFRPDRFLAASCVRADAVFSHHAALELLGAAHSDWSVCTVQTIRRRPPLDIDGARIVFLLPAPPLRSTTYRGLGTRRIDRQGRSLTVTGPERTLLEGFRQPHFAGGLEELVESAAGFGVLDLDLLLRLLERFDTRMLWAAVGWFLERHQERFFVEASYLEMLERQRPRSKQYLPRGQRQGGVLSSRWNLVLPSGLVSAGEPDEA